MLHWVRRLWARCNVAKRAQHVSFPVSCVSMFPCHGRRLVRIGPGRTVNTCFMWRRPHSHVLVMCALSLSLYIYIYICICTCVYMFSICTVAESYSEACNLFVIYRQQSQDGWRIFDADQWTQRSHSGQGDDGQGRWTDSSSDGSSAGRFEALLWISVVFVGPKEQQFHRPKFR